MAEPLKHLFSPSVVRSIGSMVRSSMRTFDTAAFECDALRGLEELELIARARHIADVLARYLPADVPTALRHLIECLPSPPDTDDANPPTSFTYMPFTIYVSEHGIDHFDLGMRANYELTQRFTAEFSIRPFILRHGERTLEMLHAWSSDPSHHVRRLVSEGTRPRLPWAQRLPAFQADPSPVVRLLERLKDDPSLYVRRSVANNLNDIGKDNPEVLYEVAYRWLNGATEDRAWVVRHALRSAIKRGEPGAFRVLGFDRPATVAITDVRVDPPTPRIGETVRVECRITNMDHAPAELLVDLSVDFVRASGSATPKVFKLTTVQLPPGESVSVRKTVSLRQHTTRTHYPGRHRVRLLVNNVPHELGAFTLTAS
jgi:3-methyladenine DNA glycosylase AlkC